MGHPLRNLAVFSRRSSFFSDDTDCQVSTVMNRAVRQHLSAALSKTLLSPGCCLEHPANQALDRAAGTLRLTVELRKQNCGPIAAAETLAGPGGSEGGFLSLPFLPRPTAPEGSPSVLLISPALIPSQSQTLVHPSCRQGNKRTRKSDQLFADLHAS